MDARDRLAVALIRSLNASSTAVEQGFSDENLLLMYGNTARILAVGIRQAISEEVARQLSDMKPTP